MSKFIFFRTPKPKGFSYKPLYHDQTKERIEKLKNQLDSEGSTDDEINREEFKINLHNNYKRLRKTRSISSSGQNRRLLIILMALIILFWYFMKSLF